MIKSKESWFLMILLSFMAVQGHAMGAMGKCVFIVTALADPSAIHPIGWAGQMNSGLQYAPGLKREIEDYQSGAWEELIVRVGDDQYPSAYQKYLTDFFNLQQAHEEFMKERPDFQFRLQTFFNQVCCNKSVMQDIYDSFKCCDESRCSPEECRVKQDWPDAVWPCMRLEDYSCGTNLPIMVPNEIRLPRRFSKMAEIKQNPLVVSSSMQRLAQVSLNESQAIFHKFEKTRIFGPVVRNYNEGNFERFLIKQDSYYGLALKLYAGDCHNLFEWHRKYIAEEPPFQAKLQQYFDKICCAEGVIEGIKESLYWCHAHGYPAEKCPKPLLIIWAYAFELCTDKLSEFPCNKIIPELAPQMSLKYRFNETASGE